MTTRTENTITYSQTFNVENRLSVVTNTTANPDLAIRFYYDGDGTRVKKEEQAVGGSVTTTLYVGAVEIQLTASTRITKTYYSAGAQMIAMREVTSTANVTGTLRQRGLIGSQMPRHSLCQARDFTIEAALLVSESGYQE